MPVKYVIDTNRRVVYLRYNSHLTYEEWEHTMILIAADPRYERGFGFFADRSISYDFADEDFLNKAKNFLERHQDKFGGSRWAVIVNHDEAYRMALLQKAITSQIITVEVFHDAKLAQDWLDSASPV